MNTAESQNITDVAGTADRRKVLDAQTLVHRYAPAVLGVCLAHAKSMHDGEDLMQEVFLKAVSKLHTLRDSGKVRGWLMQIARRTCIDHYRRRINTQQIPDDLPAADDDTGNKISRLHRAISQLPESFREPISLYYLNGRNCASVAKTLGISETAVRSRLARARLRLHEILSEDSP